MWSKVVDLFKREPGLFVAVAVAAAHVAVAFGVKLTAGQEMSLADLGREAVLLLGAAAVARTQTQPAGGQ